MKGWQLLVRLLSLLTVLGEEFKFAWLSDLHLDVEYSPMTGQRDYCRSDDLPYFIAHKCRRLADTLHVNTSAWDPDVLNVEVPAGPSLDNDLSVPLLPAYHGRYGCDSPPTLVWATLLSLRERLQRTAVEFLLITGDFAGHYWSDRRCMRSLTLVAGTNLVKEVFKPGARSCKLENFNDQRKALEHILTGCGRHRQEEPVMPQAIFCVGNNDLKRDYIPEENSEWNKELFKLWKDWVVPDDQKEVFVRGLYYAVPLRNNALKTSVICLNTMWWSRSGPPPKAVDDPAGQYAWLENQLLNASTHGQSVIIAGHIPPAHALYRMANAGGGFTVDRQWHDHHNKRYHLLLKKLGNVVKGQYFGHFHTDDIRFQTRRHKQSGDVDPTGLVLIAPGVCPNHGNNPSWRLVTAETKPDWVMKDYEQVYSPLYGDDRQLGTFDSMRLLRFVKEYLATERFKGVKDLSLGELFDHYWRTLNTEGYRKYWNAQVAMGDFPPNFIMRCVIQEDWVTQSVRKCVHQYINETQGKVKLISQ